MSDTPEFICYCGHPFWTHQLRSYKAPSSGSYGSQCSTFRAECRTGYCCCGGYAPKPEEKKP